MQELFTRITHANKKISINHMYFHPSTKMMKALVEAIEIRNVELEIITCGVYENCPNSHYAFGPRNKYNYTLLINSLSKKKRKNVHVFEFQQIKKGLHKKVITIDDEYILSGSSNFGYKSMVTTSDHEVNFETRSKDFAKKPTKFLKKTKNIL